MEGVTGGSVYLLSCGLESVLETNVLFHEVPLDRYWLQGKVDVSTMNPKIEEGTIDVIYGVEI